ncbi:transposase [Streptomyces sp. NPDC005533]|uniref:transposase n=1 Tax=Streptomyces sp. NPDC005533 TaxID=3364723 RepID=UPI00369C7E8F
MQLGDEGGLLLQLTRRLLESALEGERTDHYGYDRHPEGKNGGRSGKCASSRTVITDVGPVEIDMPQYRQGVRTTDREEASAPADRRR